MDLNDTVFINLFREVCEKCFGHPLTEPLSETDSKLLSNTIFQQTGLVIGGKSIKNYSQYVFTSGETKKENPSVATLDTLARYVLNAPYIDEIQRKNKESHHPWWFQYKSKFSKDTIKNKKALNWKKIAIASAIVLCFILTFILFSYLQQVNRQEHLTEHFNSVEIDSLKRNGWMIQKKDTAYWNKRDQKPGHLSLYTLKGDNWPDAENHSGIKNLLVRRMNLDCFTAEIHFSNFIPMQNWQQAGILLSEDPSFTGKVLRLSIGYNDFFGGYVKSPEILIQAVGSSEAGNLSKPEELAHVVLFSIDQGKDSLVADNLSRSVLKIEKKDNHYRFLYSNGQMESFAFKEAAHGNFNIKPKYLGLFAMQGLAASESAMPVHFDSFRVLPIDCTK